MVNMGSLKQKLGSFFMSCPRPTVDSGLVQTQENEVKSKTAQFRINATKRVNMGMIPLFVQLGHQGLTKSDPTPVGQAGKLKVYNIPKDILSVSVSDPKLYEDIESIEFVYRSKD